MNISYQMIIMMMFQLQIDDDLIEEVIKLIWNIIYVLNYVII